MKTSDLYLRLTFSLALLAAISWCHMAIGGPVDAVTWAKTIEQDWLAAEEVEKIVSTTAKAFSTSDDAAGGCDGVIDGEYGFHTSLMANPWWQVDLGAAMSVERVVIWNRKAMAERAASFMLQKSADGRNFETVYTHNGIVFLGFHDQKPLTVTLTNVTARFLRITLPGTDYLHLDEVQVFGVDASVNLALGKPANQSSLSQWSRNLRKVEAVDWAASAASALQKCAEISSGSAKEPARLAALKAELAAAGSPEEARQVFIATKKLLRSLLWESPLLKQFDTLLFTKRVPPSYNHMSDQYYGWWSRPGGGIYLLRDMLTERPSEQCITTAFKESGSFLRPALSHDASKVLFAWCRHYPHLAGETNKLDKSRVPEDAFYHLYEMNLDGSALRKLTFGKYDDFDGRYLPDGRIVFLSTRRGQAMQAGVETAAKTLKQAELPDCYVRCGGGPERPVAVYTLHTMNPDGSAINAISPFEMFEWTPEIAHDGSILHSRWDYIDRSNMPFMGLWAINPDGSSPRSVFKNYTPSPHCTFEPRPVPGSTKIVFTASAHHAQTMGSLVLLDPAVGTEGNAPMKRLTPEVPFPEAESWPLTYYANPFPLSERFYLVAWGADGVRVEGPQGWNRWHSVQRPSNGTAIYVYDAETRVRELVWADPAIGCGDPIPVMRKRPLQIGPSLASSPKTSTLPAPPVLATRTSPRGSGSGTFLLSDVYRGLTNVQRGAIKSLRIVAVPPKTHPTMNYPSIGLTGDDPGKCVLGTVPVEEDGSAFFKVPSGVIVFFQALDAEGVAVQTMRSVTHVQPGQTLSCIGCHENRSEAPGLKRAVASHREPSRMQPGPEGSWPLRFDRMVQPVLESKCIGCHSPNGREPKARAIDLSPARAYETLVSVGAPSIRQQVVSQYHLGTSIEGQGIARQSRLWNMLRAGHHDVLLNDDERARLLTWLDTYAHRQGSFSAEQERELEKFRIAVLR